MTIDQKNIESRLEKRTISLMGIPFYCSNIEHFIDLMIENCLKNQKKENNLITATGAHGLSLSRRDKDFAMLLKNSYLNLPDGIPAVLIGRLKGASAMKRCPGPDFFEKAMRKTAPHRVAHFFLGGREGIAEKLVQSCKINFHNDKIVGTICPPFRTITDDEIQSYAEDINAKGTDILWIGISTPKQEFLAQRLSRYTKVYYIITVGAAFDFHTGNLKKAPLFLQKIGFEWAYRLYKEPKRLFKRYAIAVPEVIFFGITDIINYKQKQFRNRR
jgi:N-acetylglucosaminyldiphosphoundecaprenol N-acetyl-beta-D-mannosaminyltransferase